MNRIDSKVATNDATTEAAQPSSARKARRDIWRVSSTNRRAPIMVVLWANGSPRRAGFYYRAIVASNGMRIGRFCIDWKVVAGLAAVAVGILLVQPRIFISALPPLLVAACPPAV